MALIFYGPSSYATTWAPSGTTAKFNIPAVIDAATTGVSGSISVQLWYFGAAYTGSPQQTSYEVASYNYPATLKAGQEYKPLSATVPVTNPGVFQTTTFYASMLLVETSGATSKIDAYQNFGSVTLTRYNGPGGDGGSGDNSGGSGDSSGSAGSSNQGSDNSYGSAPTQDASTFITLGTSGTITGAAWPSLMLLQADKSYVTSLGTDTVVAQAGAATVNASGTPLYFGGSGPTVFNETGGSATLLGGAAETVNAGSASVLIFGGSGGVSFLAGAGTSTVVSGAGGGTLNGGAGATLFFGTGTTVYRAGAGVDTVISYAGGMTATGGANGTTFFTGSNDGGDVLTTGSGSDTINGFSAGDVFNVTNAAANIVAAVGAASTINGATSTGTNSFFAFAPNDVVIGGSGNTAIQSAFGNQTLVAGSGATLFDILDTGSAHTVLVSNFNAARDVVMLGGYPSGAATTALGTATVAAGSETIALTDGTTVTFQGITGLTSHSFV